MRTKPPLPRFSMLAGLALAALALTSCKEPPSAATLRWKLEGELPGVEFERQFHIRLGRVSMKMARGLASIVLDDEEEEMRMLRAVRKMEVGIYDVHSLPDDAFTRLAKVERKLGADDWLLAVRTLDAGEGTWVFHREDSKGQIRQVYVVVLDSEELVMVHVLGRIDELLAEALANDPMQVAFALGAG